jgi:acetylornithine deacetylase/succinyl-diaminopimelate desuccinylase-like protein
MVFRGDGELRPWMKKGCGAIFAGLLFCAFLQAAPLPPIASQQLARSIFQQLIEINTTDSVGDTTVAANAMAERLKQAGMPAADIHILGPAPKRGNLVARLHGTGQRKPLLLLAHLDVVEAKRSDWSMDPFVFNEKDGYFYGRGTTDDKASAAIYVATFIRFLQEGYRPDRDIVLALTADEETGDHNGVDWLVANHKDMINAAFGLNEGGDGMEENGKKVLNGVQASEKVFLTFRMTATNPGGHSSLPRKDNAIYQIAEALVNIEHFAFPLQLNEVTRTYLLRAAKLQTGPVSADMAAVAGSNPPADAVERLSQNPLLNARMRTTCIATMVEGGHAENALPQKASATVNCRLVPTDSLENVKAALTRLTAGTGVELDALKSPMMAPFSPLTPEVMSALERTTDTMWPSVPVVPLMGTGATDSKFLRAAGIPMYGVSGLFGDGNDVRAHGRDERLGVRQFYEGEEFNYRLIRALTEANQ